MPEGLSFVERVGFRYCVDNSLRASAAAVYWRTNEHVAVGLAGVVLERIGRARVEEAIPIEEWLEAAAETEIGNR